MDKHKKFKRPKSSPASLDGIISDGRGLGIPTSRSYQPSKGDKTPTLGEFIRKDDGFHPLRQSQQSLGYSPEAIEERALLDEPIVLDDIDGSYKKKRKLKKRHSHRARFLKRASLGLLTLVVVAAAYFGFKFYQTQQKILAGGGKAPAVCDSNINADNLKGEGDGRVNILVLGNGGAEHRDGPDLTDTLLVISIDTINDKAAILSIPRDLWVRIPGNGSRKINEAYFHGKEESEASEREEKIRDGIKLVDETLEKVIGVPIHYNALVSFAAFRQSVNAVGGVDINVPKELAVSERLWDEFTRKSYNLNVGAGQQHFDGQRALFFARSRLTSTRGDFDRSERQRLMLIALKDKALSAGTFSNPVKVSQLLDSLGDNVYTDFDTRSIKCLYKKMSEIPSTSIASLDLVTPPQDLITGGSMLLGGKSVSIQQPKSGLYNYDDIQNYIRNALRDSFIAKENSSIAVYNATSTVGLAAKKANELKSYGYNITTVDNAKATDPATTIIVDLTKGSHKYTKNYLEDRFGVTVRSSMPVGSGLTPPVGTNFVIILGEDVTDSR
ncbi:LCP family protein [Candidatus Saccharibacteria bacterium]|nr:LCP family protein [Candidatus Saccharibacteria bacterium]